MAGFQKGKKRLLVCLLSLLSSEERLGWDPAGALEVSCFPEPFQSAATPGALMGRGRSQGCMVGMAVTEHAPGLAPV